MGNMVRSVSSDQAGRRHFESPFTRGALPSAYLQNPARAMAGIGKSRGQPVNERTPEDVGPSSAIARLLANWDDFQLFQLTKFYRDRLEQAVEGGVNRVSSALAGQSLFSGQEHEKVTELADLGDRADSSKVLLSLVMEKGSRARRVMWDTFVNMRDGAPKLDKILKEILDDGFVPYEYIKITSQASTLPDKLKGKRRMVLKPRPFGDLCSHYSVIVRAGTKLPALRPAGVKEIVRRMKGAHGNAEGSANAALLKHKDTLLAQTGTLRVSTVLKSAAAGAFQLIDRYVELTIIFTVRDRRLVEHELLARGRDHEEWREEHLRTELEKIRTDQLFQSSFSRTKSQTGCSAAVAGVPGIGKTTMVQKIVNDWATEKMYQQFQFVFRFRFRDLNTINCTINLWNLVLIFYPYLTNVLGELWKDPEKLLFIFDGLDEFKDRIDFADGRRDTDPQRKCTDPEFRCKVSDIVYNLIQHKLLPGCSVLVTTRPTALYLLEKADISVWAEILGFEGKEREEYFHRCFEDQTVAAAVFKHVRENEILYTMSYNPSYCCILALALGPFFMQSGRDLHRVPRTVTQVYSYYISNILKNHGREIESPRDVLLRVGQMAFTGVLEQKIVFTDGDLISYNLRNSQFLSGFLGELLERQDSAQSVVYTFPHLTVQEFVAALGQFLTPGPKDALEHLAEADKTTDGRFEIFLRFVAGFTFPGSAEPLEEVLGTLPRQTTLQVTGWVEEKIARQIEKAKGDSGNRGLLNAMHYLFESQNCELVQATMGSVVTLSFSYLKLTPNDCAVVSHVIAFCGVIKRLDLQNCHILCEGFQQLGPGLQKCQELRLDNNSLTASSSGDLVTVVSTIRSLTELELGYNKLGDSGDISSALSANRSLKTLNLGSNDLRDSGIKLVAAALRGPNCKIQKLGLWAVGLTAACAEDLVSTLTASDSLTELELGFNHLGDSGVERLGSALRKPQCQLQEQGNLLDMGNVECCKSVHLFIRGAWGQRAGERRGHSSSADLYHVSPTAAARTDDDGGGAVRRLFRCQSVLPSSVHWVEDKLDCVRQPTVAGSFLDAATWAYLLTDRDAAARFRRQSPVPVRPWPSSRFCPSRSSRPNDIAGIAQRCLTPVFTSTFRLDNNGLTLSCVKELASALRRNTSLLRLDLGFNRLGDSGVSLLWQALNVRECKLQGLRLRAVGLTDSCTEHLLSVLEFNSSLKALDLSSNAFTDGSIPAIRRLIMNRNSLENIQLVGNQFTSGGEKQLQLLQGIRNKLSVFV
ncbi:NACHT, LRR and PYD domains-containing protein 3-like [Mobula birostris]|uniref:NACHT, LRR and PYD domains-containing protein 3-like n=1 Tax=Mobula birostris TaxID=1983395 RepID=UPI003B27C62A